MFHAVPTGSMTFVALITAALTFATPAHARTIELLIGPDGFRTGDSQPADGCEPKRFSKCGIPITGVVKFTDAAPDGIDDGVTGSTPDGGPIWAPFRLSLKKVPLQNVDAQSGSFTRYDVLIKLGYPRFQPGDGQDSRLVSFGDRRFFTEGHPFGTALTLNKLIVWSNHWQNGFAPGSSSTPGIDVPGVVPAPPAVILFGTGLMMLFGFAFRRKAR